jgi:glycosyltransferase involved in cell wall biosynthesis
VVTTVHEPYVPFDRLKTLPMAIIQRLELWLLILGSAKIAVSISAWTRMLQARFFWRKRDIFWLPVGSNIPRLPLSDGERAMVRANLGVGAGDLLVVMFNPGGSGKMVDLAANTWNAIRSVNPMARLLLIGCSESDSPFRGCQIAEGVLHAGYVQADEASRLLSSGDLCLAPYIDGISARRGSVIAALAHGLPTVSTTGALTDQTTFQSSPVVLTDVGDDAGFMAAAAKMAGDTAGRTALRTPLIEFHQRHFSWSFIADSLLARAAQ